MPLHYCSSCAAKITYQAAKPDKCPKCNKPIRDSLAILTQSIKAAPTVQEVPYEDSDMNEGLTPEIVKGGFVQDDDGPIAPPARSSNSRPIVHKDRRRQIQRADASDEDFGGESEYYDRNQAKRLARQWAQAFDPDGVEIAPQVKGERVSFGQLWAEGKSSREGQA